MGIYVSVQFPEKMNLPKASAKMFTSGTNLRKAEQLHYPQISQMTLLKKATNYTN